jgi:hypothetical protein
MPAPRRVPTLDESTEVFATHDRRGVPVSLRWTTDIDTPNRGWVVHEMGAWRAGERVGYLRVSYVPKAHIPLFQPSVLHHLGSITGWCLPALFDGFHGPARDPACLTDAEVAEVRACVCAHLGAPNAGWTTIKAMVKALQGPLNRRGQGSYAHFQAFHVDKPIVDYVRTDVSVPNGVPNDNRGQGLGLLLYGAVAHHLPTLGMRLHASSDQSLDAQEMWAFFASQSWTERVGARTVLNPHIHNHPHHVLAHCPSAAAATA